MNNTFIFLLLIGMFTMPSCVSHKELVNFDEAELPEDVPYPVTNALELLIQPDDILRITVHSLDPEAAAPFNIEPLANNNAGNVDPSSLELFNGYIVDRKGNIDFPLVGQIKVEGMTLEAVKDVIVDKLAKYLKDPVVNARYLNFKVTVLGEVNAPGVVRLTNSRVTVLDILGLSGDLTDYADRSDILLVREDNEQRVYKHLDLHSGELFSSPYFYLKQNDVIYVKPIKAKTATVADPAARIVSYGTAALSVITLIIALTRNGN